MIRVRCPICKRLMSGEQAEWPQFPFCSDRCRLVDLGRWLNEEYRLGTDEDEEAAPQDGNRESPP